MDPMYIQKSKRVLQRSVPSAQNNKFNLEITIEEIVEFVRDIDIDLGFVKHKIPINFS